jgi:hypothetical protein
VALGAEARGAEAPKLAELAESRVTRAARRALRRQVRPETTPERPLVARRAALARHLKPARAELQVKQARREIAAEERPLAGRLVPAASTLKAGRAAWHR